MHVIVFSTVMVIITKCVCLLIEFIILTFLILTMSFVCTLIRTLKHTHTHTHTHSHTHTQDISCIISSPFLRCLQTAQKICNSLELPGLTTCNGIVDVLSSHCGIHEQPIVPADNIADSGINVLVFHHEAIPKFPEQTRDGLKR